MTSISDYVRIHQFMKKALLLSTVVLLFAANTAFAGNGSSSCEIQYGGGQICPENINFSIDKKVALDKKGGTEFVDNLTINDARFNPNDTVTFQIVVKNTGTKRIENIDVTDTLPTFLNFVAGPGKYDPSTRQFTLRISKLDSGEEFKFTLTAQFATEANLPANQGVTCVVNEARASLNGQTATDTAQVCVSKSVVIKSVPSPKVFGTVPMKQTPPTGPEAALAAILPVTGLLGLYLRKKSSLK